MVHWQGRLAWVTAVASLYMAEVGLLAGLELVVQLVLVLVHVLQEVRSQGRQGWMRKIGVDHNIGDAEWGSISEFVPTGSFTCKGDSDAILLPTVIDEVSTD